MFSVKISKLTPFKNLAFVLLGASLSLAITFLASDFQSRNVLAGSEIANASNLNTTDDISYQLPQASELGQKWFTCRPIGVAVFDIRIHVQCQESVGSVSFFALSNSDVAQTARVLSVLSTAHVSGRNLNILYDPNDTSGTSIACPVDSCRLIEAVIIAGL